MLPSTGFFNAINCPFYDNGLCERPYCHYRHVRKESQNSNEGSGAILQKLVSAAVQRVLQQTDSSQTPIQADSSIVTTVAGTKATYNPTPIAELNKISSADIEDVNNEDCTDQRKRHIPVPYTPRKPASLPIQRPIVDTNGASKPFIYIPPPITYKPGSAEITQCDKYTPIGSTVSSEKYLPGTDAELQKYSPDEDSNQSQNAIKRNYVPSDKTGTKKKILEYKPTKVTKKPEASSVTYQPTPKALAPCFSSDEDEPETKKSKLATDLNGLDDLGPEFDILDQILDEEKETHVKKDNVDSVSKETVNNGISSKDSAGEKIDGEKKHSKSHHKSSSDRKVKEKKEKQESKNDKLVDSTKKTKHKSDKKDKHKSSSKDKEKHEKDRQSEKRKGSSSKSSNHSSKHSSSKKSDSESKSRSKSKSDEKSSHKKSHKSSKHSKHHNNHNSSDNDENIAAEVLEEVYSSEPDEDSIALECKKIFDEYVPTEKPKVSKETVQPVDVIEEEYIPSKKRVSRAADTEVKVQRKAPVKPNFKVSSATTMAERLAKVREYHSSKRMESNDNVENKNTNGPQNIPLSNPVNSTGKIRIAHVPYASTLLYAKKTMPPNPIPNQNTNSEPSTSSTVAQTLKKGVQRVAHMPNEKFIDRPGVLEPLGSKIPANIRSTYLNMMIDECLKMYLTSTDAYARAQHEELTTSKKCSAVQIYKNSAVLTISRLRKELQECKGVKKLGTDCQTLQRVPGAPNTTGSWSILSSNRKQVDNSKEFIGAKLYNNISKWILTEEQLKDNGFPRPHESREKGRAIIYGQNKQKPPKGFIRTCCRCKKEYTVDKKGFPAVKEDCIYHPNNKYRVRGEAKYQCCSQDGSSDGCCIASSHVYEYVDYANLKGFVKTLPPDKEMEDYGIYSLDCEMCYTTQGLDLTRVTVIDSTCKVVYETLIRPLHPIIDYNTRYSGITAEQMYGVTTTLLDVQATLLTMFNSKTILVGHSLESDFKVLKLIHDTVVDTSVLFPHKMGPPYKRALRNLSSEYLKKIIQNSVDGHDSAEDATVCMELIHYKLKEDLKTR